MPTREEILSRKIGHGTVDIEGLGTFKVRALSRDQAMLVYERQRDGDLAASENMLISFGLIDPELSVTDVAEWASLGGSAGALQALSVAIGTISGMTATSGKESYKSA